MTSEPATRDDLHAVQTCLVETNTNLKASNHRLDRICKALDGNSKPGLIETVTAHGVQIKTLGKDVSGIKAAAWKVIGVTFSGIALGIGVVELLRHLI